MKRSVLPLMKCSGIFLHRKEATMTMIAQFLLYILMPSYHNIWDLTPIKIQVVGMNYSYLWCGFFSHFLFSLYVCLSFFLVWHACRDKKIFISQQNIVNTLHFLLASDNISNWTLILKHFRKLFLNREKNWFKHRKVAHF